MPIDRPTLAELSRRAEAELPLETASEPLRRNLYTPLARAIAGAVHGLYGHQEWITRQIHPQDSDDDILENVHAPIWLPGGRKPAAAATGSITVTGTAGYSLDQGVTFNRADGLLYGLTDGIIIDAGGSTTASVVCLTAGVSGNTEPGGKLRLTNPVSGINGEAVVLAPGLSGGSDIEDIEELRGRVVEARSNGGQVGRSTDWELWAKEVPGVTRAWSAPKLLGLGSMVVYFVRDGDADIFPDASEQATVQQHLEATGTPMGDLFAVAPVRKDIDFTIQLSPDTPAMREAVSKVLAGVLTKEASPVKRNATGQTELPVSGVTIPRTHFTEAISGTAGEWDHEMPLPAGDVVCTVGELAMLGTITWL
ncbi:baseplate J/gp47 family protein [Pseudogulbenkiania sp. MAI-1]|uniref:baseplate J/gp47 family protein n=1 Tax=Pseudogulbenkiania sp. MAI-1 TaxID=990370 RepID=UPI00045E6816|nr:baseplate J/gp47 family protein [Pseudogulbenkiania sp. MAI-1]